MAYLINKSGKIVGIPESRVQKYLNKGFKRVEYTPQQKQGKVDGIPVRLLTSTDHPDGYGQSQEYLTKYLKKYGIDVSKTDKGQEIGICYYTPVYSNRLKNPYKIIYSMFESTTIPSDWVKYLRKVDKVFVPSHFCQRIFATKGINSEVIPLGYDHDSYKYIERKRTDEPFTFLHYNAFNVRKGFDLVFKAFTEEFSTDEPVKMIFKTISTRTLFPILESEYPNIETIKGDYSKSQLNELLERSDCFVFPSRGEGFGLTPLEALATGLPVIIPNASGMSEYFNSDYFYEVQVKGECPALYQSYSPKDVGNMVEPDLDSLKKQMRYVFEHREEAKEKGKKGSEWVKHWSIDNTAKLLSEEIKKISGKVITDIPDIAFLTEDISFYSGGRYHSWLQALMLNESKFKVRIYTNEYPVFRNDFDLYEEPEIQIIGHGNDSKYKGAMAFNDLDVEANAYFGSPETASMNALRLGLKYRKPVYITMFDPPEWVENSDVTDDWETRRDNTLKDFLDKHLKDLVDFKLIVLTENAIDSFSKWYGLDKKYIVALHPSVNSRLIDLYDKRPERKRPNNIVAVSRNHKRKGFDDLLFAFKPFSRDHVLHLITSVPDGLESKVQLMGIPKDKVKIHVKISDADKFKLMAESKCVLSGSHFEGFGMWAIEGRAMGIPVVCYDLPSLEDVYNDSGMFKAKCFDKEDLREKLGQALGSEPLEPKTDHNFEVIQEKLLNIVKPKISVKLKDEVIPMYIVLNEQKFVGASLRSVLKRPEVNQVVIVEGADKRYPKASENGLSIDKTEKEIRKVIKDFPDKDIVYYQMGWVNGKEELRNKCIELSKQSGWGLFVDGDEVWSDYYWKKLTKLMRETFKSVIYFRHLHFWKDKNTIAIGGQWDKHLFRCFRFVEKGLIIKQHASEPVSNGIPIGDKYGREVDDSIFVHHYSGCKDGNDIRDKLEFYKKRDTNLNVRDTWTNYKKGDETQWTSQGGSVSEYKGKHPVEIKNICK